MAGLSTYCHPSLGLGNVAQPEVVDVIDRIRACEAEADAAYDRLSAAQLSKRSLTMTLNELSGMGVDTDSLTEQIERVDASLLRAAQEYVRVKIASESRIDGLRQTLCDIPATQMPESPVDFQASELRSLPLASESLKLDSRYFAFDGDMQEDKLASIEKFVRSATNAAASGQGDLSRSVCDQISEQVANHHVCGTLILTASATHRNVHLFSPYVLDPDKAVSAWNTLHDEQIDTSDPQRVREALVRRSDDSLALITGAVYGSDFVGMAHFLQSDASSRGNMDDLKARLDEKLLLGGWLANASGGTGVDQAVLDDVRAFLSANSISCHISIVATGAIPTIKSNELTTCSYRLAEVGADSILSGADAADRQSIGSEAQAARQQALLGSIRNARIGSILREVSLSDEKKNNVLNMKTLIDAFDNYIASIGSTGEVVGIPVGFYIRRVTQAEIAHSWLRRHYPASRTEQK